MTCPIVKADLVSLRKPAPNVFHLFMRVEGVDMRVEISRDALRGIIMDGTAAAWQESDERAMA